MSKVPVNGTSSYTSDSLQNQITAALIANNSIPAIQATLLHELQASGWTAALRTHVTALVRSGECIKYDELMSRVLDESVKGVVDRTRNNTNGTSTTAPPSTTVPRPGQELRIPDAAVKAGIKVVRAELEKVCDVSTK